MVLFSHYVKGPTNSPPPPHDSELGPSPPRRREQPRVRPILKPESRQELDFRLSKSGQSPPSKAKIGQGFRSPGRPALGVRPEHVSILGTLRYSLQSGNASQ